MALRITDGPVKAPYDLAWQTWDAESVVFNPRSGDTHLLDLVAAEGLRCLQQAALTADELQVQLAERLEIEADEQLQQYVEQLLVRFEDVGLVESEGQGNLGHGNAEQKKTVENE